MERSVQQESLLLEGAADRGRAVARATARTCAVLWTVAGEWQGPHRLHPEEPAWLHLARSLLITADAGMVALANRVLERAGFDTELHFKVMSSIALLLDHRAALGAEARTSLENVVDRAMGLLQAPDMGFVGVNDNYPMMAAFGLVVGGELVGDGGAVRAGRDLLRSGTDQFRRRGVSPEYGSPTYSAIQLTALAEIARRSSDTEAVELAVALEERTWLDVALRFHPRLERLAGPFSRAFLRDTINVPSLVNDVCWFALDQGPSPLEYLFGDRPEKWRDLDPSIFNRRAAAVWVTDTEYHPNRDLVDSVVESPFPRTAVATYEFASSRDALARPTDPDAAAPEIYPAGVGVATTHIRERIGVGSATVPFHNGTHGDPFHVVYDLGPDHGDSNPGSVHARYLVDDHRPGSRRNAYPTFGVERQSETGSPTLWDEGRPVTLQHEATVLSIYRPKLYATYGVSSLRLSVILSTAETDVDELWLGDDEVIDAAGRIATSAEPASVVVRHGSLLLGVLPLAITDLGRKHAVEIGRHGDFLMISYVNYHGPNRRFSVDELAGVSNGFVAEVREVTQRANGRAAAAELRHELATAALADDCHRNPHTRGTMMRTVSYRRDNVDLRCELNPDTVGVRFATVNGVDLHDRAPLTVPGMDPARLALPPYRIS